MDHSPHAPVFPSAGLKLVTQAKLMLGLWIFSYQRDQKLLGFQPKAAKTPHDQNTCGGVSAWAEPAAWVPPPLPGWSLPIHSHNQLSVQHGFLFLCNWSILKNTPNLLLLLLVFFWCSVHWFIFSLFFFCLELISVGQLLTPRLAIAGSSSHPLPLTWANNEYAGEDNALESKPLDKRGSGFWLVILYYFDDAVHIDKDHSKEKSKVCLFRASYSKRASCLAGLWQRQWRGGALRWKKEKLQVCPDWGLLTWGSGRGLTRSSHSMPRVRDVVIGLFLVARRDRN